MAMVGLVEMGGKEVEEWVGCVGYMGGVGRVNGYVMSKHCGIWVGWGWLGGV